MVYRGKSHLKVDDVLWCPHDSGNNQIVPRGMFVVMVFQEMIHVGHPIIFWLVVYLPLPKIWNSIGMMTFPTEWENQSHVPVTTNQYSYCSIHFNPIKLDDLGPDRGTPISFNPIKFDFGWLIQNYWTSISLNSGWWFQPLWKIWKSIGRMTFPIYGKIKVMFQSSPTRNATPRNLHLSISWLKRWLGPPDATRAIRARRTRRMMRVMRSARMESAAFFGWRWTQQQNHRENHGKTIGKL